MAGDWPTQILSPSTVAECITGGAIVVSLGDLFARHICCLVANVEASGTPVAQQ
jgi:hypothetical protein